MIFVFTHKNVVIYGIIVPILCGQMYRTFEIVFQFLYTL